MPERRNLFLASKYDYVRGGRPGVRCILCAIVQGDPQVEELVVHRHQHLWVCMNLYPYSPGHVMIFPTRHITDPRQMTDGETAEFKHLLDTSLDILEETYQCHGFNVGLNLGPAGGASIAHLHWHVVPRYRNETGFMDIIGGSKIIIAHPRDMKEALGRAYASKLGNHTGSQPG